MAARPDTETVDGMLASVAEGANAAPAGADATTAVAGGDAATTSYRLAPPSGAPAEAARPAAGAAGQPGDGTAAEADGGSLHDAVPEPARPDRRDAGPAGPQMPRRQLDRRRQMRRRVAVASSLAGTALTAVLVWTLLPDGDSGTTGAGAKDREVPSQVGASDSSSPSSSPSPSTAPPSKSASPPSQVGSDNLLTPDAIRSAIKEIKAETGTDRAGVTWRCIRSTWPSGPWWRAATSGTTPGPTARVRA
ncbi:hypothetical protein ACIQ7Q_07265 [Streptomyces sp. NPDC096176]|uniref:hypothetical protein n=1 Tax=Streptomyces sp. NPDC096176 TaxID=3366079 RepID=UPI0038243A35